MPPFPSWYQGRVSIQQLFKTKIMAEDGRGLWRLLPVQVNGGNGFALYNRENTQMDYQAYAIQSINLDGNLVSEITTFLNPALFRLFNLPSKIK
jgi:RNA polymerase sigma-70 factor, ECF subfamily